MKNGKTYRLYSQKLIFGALSLLLSACTGLDNQDEIQNKVDAGVQTETDPSLCGSTCGVCSAGIWNCEQDEKFCEYPVEKAIDGVDPILGLPPGHTGERTVFNVDDFDGNPVERVYKAGLAAAEVGGAVVLNQIYEVHTSITMFEGVMYSGGGIRRECTPVAEVVSFQPGELCIEVDNTDGFRISSYIQVIDDESADGSLGAITIASIDQVGKKLCSMNPINFEVNEGSRLINVFDLAKTYVDGTDDVVVDSIYFDGARECNGYSHDWRINSTLAIRGDNIVRNSVFVNTPSENLTICGGLFHDNVALGLDGSFIHKSCGAEHYKADAIFDNYVRHANQIGDEIMGHSEGLITFSANAGQLYLARNIFRDGNEGVYGLAAPDDEGVVAVNDCYDNFPDLIEFTSNTDRSKFHFEDTSMTNIGSEAQSSQNF